MFFEWLEGLRMELSGEHLLPHGTTQRKAEQTVSPDSWLMNKHSWVSHLSSVFKQSLKLCRTARVKIKTALQLWTCLPFHWTKKTPLKCLWQPWSWGELQNLQVESRRFLGVPTALLARHLRYEVSGLHISARFVFVEWISRNNSCCSSRWYFMMPLWS